MKVLDRARNALNAFFRPELAAGARGNTQNPAAFMYEMMGRRSAAGEIVTPEKALRIPAYLAGSRIVAGDVAKVGKRLHRLRPKRGSDIDEGHPVDRILHDRFNPILSSFAGWRLLVHRAMGWWGGPAEIVRNNRGEIIELWPIHPARLTPEMQADGRTLKYVWRQEGFDEIELNAEDVFVLTGIGDGIRGYSPAEFASDSLGIALAAQKHTGAFYGEGLAKKLVATASEPLKPSQIAQLQKIYARGQGGSGEAGQRKIPFLPYDVKVHELGLSPKDAQYIESLEYFGLADVSRLTGCPTWMLSSEKQAKGWSSYAMQYQAYIDGTLVHWIEEIKGESRLKFLGEKGVRTHKISENYNTLLRADVGARGDYLQKQFRNGALTRNEWRDLNSMNPDEGDPSADEFFLTQDLVPARQLLEQPDDEDEPDPAPPPPEDDEPDDEEDLDEDDAAAARVGAAISALEPMASDVAQRLARRFVIRVRSAIKKHAADDGAFRTWALDARARATHESIEAFRPVTAAAARIIESLDPSGPGTECADLHLEISLGADFDEDLWASDTTTLVMSRLRQWAGVEQDHA